jgi:hypothetical protein
MAIFRGVSCSGLPGVTANVALITQRSLVQIQVHLLSVLAGEGPAGAIAQFGAVVIPDSWGRRLPRGKLGCTNPGVAGSTPNPDARFIAQAARRLTDPVDGFW